MAQFFIDIHSRRQLSERNVYNQEENPWRVNKIGRGFFVVCKATIYISGMIRLVSLIASWITNSPLIYHLQKRKCMERLQYT